MSEEAMIELGETLARYRTALEQIASYPGPATVTKRDLARWALEPELDPRIKTPLTNEDQRG